MAFAQLTYRESLRDIEACLARSPPSSTTWASARRSPQRWPTPTKRATGASTTNSRRLIVRPRLYAKESFGVDLSETVYALDSTTIDLCLSLFPWAPFRATKAAVKLHTLLDLRGAIPTFIHISDGKMHDVNVLDLLIEPGAFYIMDRGYLDFERLYALDQAGGFFVTRAKRNLDSRACTRRR